MALFNPSGDKDWGYQNYTFGQDDVGRFVTGTTAYNTKTGVVSSGKTGKTYLDSDMAKWDANIMSAYTDSLSNDSAYKDPSTTMKFPNPTMAQQPSLLGASDPSLNGPSSGGSSGTNAGGTGGSTNLDSPAPQVNKIQGAITTTIADSPTQAPVGLPNMSNIANSLDPNSNPLNPNKIKKGLTSGQGLASTKGAGELANPALVARKSLLAG